jgi:hypothetical protein
MELQCMKLGFGKSFKWLPTVENEVRCCQQIEMPIRIPFPYIPCKIKLSEESRREEDF